MKKLMLSVALLCAHFGFAYSQFYEGNTYLGTKISFQLQLQPYQQSSKPKALDLGVQYQKFLRNNFSLGIGIDIDIAKKENITYYSRPSNEEGSIYYDYDPKYPFTFPRVIPPSEANEEEYTIPKEERYTLNVSPRYYLYENSTFRLFFHSDIRFDITTKNEVDNNQYLIRDGYKFKGYGLNFQPGIQLKLGSYVYFDFRFPIISYYHQNIKYGGSSYDFRRKNNLYFINDHFTPSISLMVKISDW